MGCSTTAGRVTSTACLDSKSWASTLCSGHGWRRLSSQTSLIRSSGDGAQTAFTRLSPATGAHSRGPGLARPGSCCGKLGRLRASNSSIGWLTKTGAGRRSDYDGEGCSTILGACYATKSPSPCITSPWLAPSLGRFCTTLCPGYGSLVDHLTTSLPSTTSGPLRDSTRRSLCEKALQPPRCLCPG
jgi:hypothetical protein